MEKIEFEDAPSTETPISADNLNQVQTNIENALAGMLDYFYPIGTIYETTSTNLDTTAKMAAHFGGTWEVYGAGRVLVAKSADTEFDTIGKTGGAKTHTLTTDEMPSHNHGILGQYPFTEGELQWALQPTNTSTPNNTINNPEVLKTTGGGLAHNNLQPYIVVYRYRRTA